MPPSLLRLVRKLLTPLLLTHRRPCRTSDGTHVAMARIELWNTRAIFVITWLAWYGPYSQRRASAIDAAGRPP
jgi:hypothetical protein